MVLDALYEERNVTRAAEKLSLTQPTVSGQLKRLRDLFEDELFVRTSHGVIPTPRADDLAKRARDVIEAMQGLLVDESFDPNRDAFSAILSGSDFLNQTLLANLTSAIMVRAPKACISVIAHPADRIAQRMGRGEIDLFFSTGDKVGLDLPQQELFGDQLVCFSSFAHHRPGQNIALEEICGLQHIKLQQTATALSNSIERALSARGAKRNIAVHVPNLATLTQVMASTELVCFLPQSLACLLGPSVKMLKVELDLPAAEISVYWHPRFDHDPRHLWLRQVMADTVTGLATDRAMSVPEHP